MDQITNALEVITNNPLLSMLIGAGLLDAALRRKETQKAISLIHVFQGFLQGGIRLLSALDRLISKVIPHKVATPVEVQKSSDGK